MINSIEKDLEQYLQTHPELSDFGYNNAYTGGDLIGIISAKENMKKHEESYTNLEERLSLKDDKRAYTSLFGGIVRAAIFTIVGAIPILGAYAYHNLYSSDTAPEIRNVEVYCSHHESIFGSYHIAEVDITAYDADGDKISIHVRVTDGNDIETLTLHLPPYNLSDDGKTQYFHLKESTGFGDGDTLTVTAYSRFDKTDSESVLLDCD
jgi:hypothetical protein